jgi:hypothetical protein
MRKALVGSEFASKPRLAARVIFRGTKGLIFSSSFAVARPFTSTHRDTARTPLSSQLSAWGFLNVGVHRDEVGRRERLLIEVRRL